MPRPVRPLIEEPIEDAFRRIQRFVNSQAGGENLLNMILIVRRLHQPGPGTVDLQLATDAPEGMTDEIWVNVLRGAADYFNELADMTEGR